MKVVNRWAPNQLTVRAAGAVLVGSWGRVKYRGGGVRLVGWGAGSIEIKVAGRKWVVSKVTERSFHSPQPPSPSCSSPSSNQEFISISCQTQISTRQLGWRTLTAKDTKDTKDTPLTLKLTFSYLPGRHGHDGRNQV